jgi:hypothetical protein
MLFDLITGLAVFYAATGAEVRRYRRITGPGRHHRPLNQSPVIVHTVLKWSTHAAYDFAQAAAKLDGSPSAQAVAR